MRILIQISSSIFLGILVLLASCVTHNQKFEQIDNYVTQENYVAAYNNIQEENKSIYHKKRDQVLSLLDSGMLALHAKKTPESLSELSEADAQMDELRKKNIGEQIAASTVNDILITYNGSDYEYVFTSIMLSLGYLLENKFDSGFVEIRRTQDKLTKIQVDNNILVSEYKKNADSYIPIDEIKIPFVDSAFARMMSFWLYRADGDLSNMEVAARKYDEAIFAQPTLYPFEPPPIIEKNQFSTSGNRIQIVSLTDRSPILYSNYFSLNLVPDGVVILSLPETNSFTSNITPIEDNNFLEGLGVIQISGLKSTGISLVFDVPAMATYEKKVDRIEIWTDDIQLGTLVLTEDLEKMAIATFNENKKLIYARQISRIIIKTLLGVTANEIDPLLGFITQIANNVSEKADLRISRYFPARIWTGDFIIPKKGNYLLTIKYFRNDNVIKKSQQTIGITKNNDTFNLIVDSFL